ncbi:MAG: MFS transporter [Planctomycetota bacterium]
MIIEIILSIGLIKITLGFCDERKPKITMLFDAWGCFWKYVAAGFLYVLIIMIPPAACILLPMFSPAAMGIPHLALLFFIMAFILAVALSIKFSLCFYFVVDKGLGPINALRASSRTTMDAKGALFLFGILCSLINLLGVLCFGIGLFATFPTVMVAMALVYRQLSTQSPELNEFGISSPLIQTDPVTLSGLSIRHVPTDHPVPAIQPNAGIQPVSRNQPNPADQPVLRNQPDSDTQHFIGKQPGARIHSGSGNQPHTDLQHVLGDQPDPAPQHVLGNQPNTGMESVPRVQPQAGNQPDPATQSAPRVRPIPAKKKNNSFLLVVLLALAVVIVAGTVYYLRPASTKAETLNKDVVLTGILYVEGNSSAVVDGKIVHEGDTINGAKVIKIHEDKVDFERAGETWTQRVE